MRRLTTTVFFFLTVTLLTVNCTNGIAGEDSGGSEITNGKILTMADVPAAGIEVAAYPIEYIDGSWSTDRVITTSTDAAGGFTLTIDSGLYNVYIADSASGSGCLIRDVGPKQDLGTIRLENLGTIEGTISVDSTLVAPILIIFSKGTPLRVNIASADGIFRFDRVPSGAYSLSVAKMPPVGCTPGIDCVPGGTGAPADLQNIIVPSGGTAMIDTTLQVGTLGELP